jgi:hypothetical protein
MNSLHLRVIDQNDTAAATAAAVVTNYIFEKQLNG